MYYKIVLNLFILRFDETGIIRHQAVNMWKLITVKPVSTMVGFMQYVIDTLLGLLQRSYSGDEDFGEFEIKKVVQGVIGELMVNLSVETFEQFTSNLYERMDKASEDELVYILDIFAAIAKNDKGNHYIKNSLIE